jgi:hypothetical protein
MTSIFIFNLLRARAIAHALRGGIATALFATALAACGSDEGISSPPGGSGGSGGSGSGDAGGGDPLYAISTEIMSDDSSTSYVRTLKSIDAGEIDIKAAREFAGRATIAAFNGSLYVADGETPSVLRFSVDEGGNLAETGRVSFLNYGQSSVALDDWNNTFVSPTKAYMIDWASGNQIVWNPEAMTISGQIEIPGLVKQGWEIDGTPGIVRGNRMYRVFVWGSWETYSFAEDQSLVVIDIETDKVVSTITERRCPALNNRITRDESDNLYFSNWIYNVPATLTSGAAKSCALRIKAGSDSFDPHWSLAYAPMTEGREAAGFVYLPGDRGLLDVFHHERVTIDANTDPLDLALSTNWRMWTVDLTTRTAKQVEGLDWLAGGFSVMALEGRSFVMVPGANYTRTFGYEVSPEGVATRRFETRGWSSQLVKVR